MIQIDLRKTILDNLGATIQHDLRTTTQALLAINLATSGVNRQTTTQDNLGMT